MNTIEIKKTNAISAWIGADQPGKKLLEDLLGKENVSGNIMDMVKSYKDACAVEGTDPIKNLPYANPQNADEEHDNNVKKVKVIIRVLNGGWKPDYSDGKQYKWYCWFRYDPSVSAFRFDDTDDAYTGANTGTGSRHTCRTDQIATHVGSEFIDKWNKWLLR